MPAHVYESKTYSPGDLADPDVARVAGDLRRFALLLGLSGRRFAVNGILRRRFWVRRHKLWEYARGLACLGERGARRILDFGGGATLPVYFLAREGCEVLSLDVDEVLTYSAKRTAESRGWKLVASTYDLTQFPPLEEWGRFDAAISFSVLEHLPRPKQLAAVERLASVLRPGGVLALTFDYGSEAPVEHALRTPEQVAEMVAAARLEYLDGRPFQDAGERFALDRRHPGRRFTFASLFLRKPA
jgi:SAM-dependent methyltransferase